MYAITAEGKEVFGEWANKPGPEAWEDEGFAAHLAFFSATEARTRLRILEGRRSRLEERVDALRDSLARSKERVDAYTLQLQQHGLEGAERQLGVPFVVIDKHPRPGDQWRNRYKSLCLHDPVCNPK